MRELGKLDSDEDARLFADHLRGLGISTKLVGRAPNVTVWVHDENRMTQAAEELQLFERDRSNPRFETGAKAARAVDEAAKRADRLYRKNFVEMSDRWHGPLWKRMPVVLALMIISVIIYVATGQGKDYGSFLLSLTFSQLTLDLLNGTVVDTGLDAIEHGQIWRVITPIFLHFSIFHLVFNLMWVRSLGGLIESRKGTLKFLALVLVLAATSNFGQYLEASMRNRFSIFGGMSGVVYGLFGYAWIKGLARPQEGIGVDSRNVQLMLIWFAICLTGAVGPIANSAHGVGLVMGILIALTPF